MPNIDPFDYPIKRMPKEYNIVNVTCFFDIVGFTKGTTNHQMRSMVRKINDVIGDLLWEDYYWNEKEKEDHNDLILIPTGDGYGIGFKPNMSNDKIISIIIDLYKLLRIGNNVKITMGVAKGPNIRHVDMNDTVNLFGYGINLASRVVSLASPNQILVHSEYAEELKRVKRFSELIEIKEPHEIKHQETIYVYNLYKKREYGIAVK